MQRRHFLQNTSMALMALPFIDAACSQRSTGESSAGSRIPIGIQLYSIASLLSENFKQTLKTIAAVGYKKLEFAGPYYFSSQEEKDNSIMLKFLGLKGYGYYDIPPTELRAYLDELGLEATSAHISLQSLDENIEEALNAAQIMGHQYIICPMVVTSSIDEYKSLADKFNVIGEACNKSGIRFGYHNHSLEFGARSGEIPMDVLLQRTDPNLVSFELDVFWTTVAGIDAVKYINDHPGRFKLMHLKDMKTKMDQPDTDWQTFTVPAKAQAMFAKETSVGEGIIDFKTIIPAAEKAGVQHFFIEQDFPKDPSLFINESFTHASTF